MTLIELPAVRKRTTSPDQGRMGMTLIELLISLAIIGIMAGIAFPIFSYYQKRSVVESDIRNFVQLFNYARALQNNPENYLRTGSNADYHYVIKFINNSGINRAELYSSADPETIIDKADFSEDIRVNNKVMPDNGLTLSFSGTPPKETITCSINCDTSINISLKSTGSGGVTKTAEILNTSSSQLLSINIK